jgi:hypothetical protein
VARVRESRQRALLAWIAHRAFVNAGESPDDRR